MREILFRGKRSDNGEWVEGYYTTVSPMFGNGVSVIETRYYDFMVETDTVGQFTGLTDKYDRKVFEGDILAYHLDGFESETIAGVVKYGNMNCSCCDGVYGWFIEGGDIRCLDMGFTYDDDERLYIVGNIHDNPDLLKGEK